MPIDYKQYPPNWDKIRAGILKRAGNRCECCGVQNLIRGWRDDSGVFIPGENDKKRCFMIILRYPTPTTISTTTARKISGPYVKNATLNTIGATTPIDAFKTNTTTPTICYNPPALIS